MAATPPATAFASASLYVGDLGSEVTEALLFETFNAVGPVASVRVCRDAATRRSLGYAYVNFHRVEDAERALDTMNFKDIRPGQPCRIMWSHRDPSLRRSGKGNIFVKNLSPEIDNKSLYDTFSIFGNILSVKVATNAKGESLKYGFVHYENEESATKAIAEADGKEIDGHKVNVVEFKSSKERGGDKNVFTNIYVKNITEDVTEEALRELFAKHGTITSCKLVCDAEGKSRGFGFVNFEAPEMAAAAVEALNGHEMGENKLFVGRAQKKSERQKELSERFEQLKLERQKKYDGVNLYVKNLSDQIDDDKLREAFSKYGEITSARVMVDNAQKSRGFGFVCFSGSEEASKAADEMNNSMLDGKPLYVRLAQRKDVRRQQLETQYTGRKGGMGMMGYPGQPGPPVYYQPGMPQQRMVYPPQQMMRFSGQQMMGPQAVNYQLMAVNQQRGGGRNRRNQQGRGNPRNQRGQQQQQQMHPRQQQQHQQQHQHQQQQQQPQQPQQQQQQQLSPADSFIKTLAEAPEADKKQLIGGKIYPRIMAIHPEEAAKITGMLLEMDNGELLHLLDNDEALNQKVNEALMVLQESAQAE